MQVSRLFSYFANSPKLFRDFANSLITKAHCNMHDNCVNNYNVLVLYSTLAFSMVQCFQIIVLGGQVMQTIKNKARHPYKPLEETESCPRMLVVACPNMPA